MAEQNDRVARKTPLAHAEREVSSMASISTKQTSATEFGDRDKTRFRSHLLHQGRTMSEHVYLSNIRRNFDVYAKLHSGLDYDEFGAAVRRNDPIIEKMTDAVEGAKRGRFPFPTEGAKRGRFH
jgi:hypothetical protein